MPDVALELGFEQQMVGPQCYRRSIINANLIPQIWTGSGLLGNHWLDVPSLGSGYSSTQEQDKKAV